MFRSSTIIRELALNLAMAKVIFMLKHSVKLRRRLLCGCVAACNGMACVLHAVQNAQHVTHTPFHEMLPHNCIINNDVISPNVLT
jgi:predicted membrane-bound spermidine synthase